MAFLAEGDRALLIEHFSAIETPVELVLFTKPPSGILLPGGQEANPHGQSSADTQTLLQEVAELSEKIELYVHDVGQRPEKAEAFGVTEVPTIAVCPEGNDVGIRFMGLPSGYEFTSLIETINVAGGAGPPLLDETLEKIASLEAEIDIKTFSTPT